MTEVVIRDILDTGVLDALDYVLRQLPTHTQTPSLASDCTNAKNREDRDNRNTHNPNNFDGIVSWHVAVQTLPFCDPGVSWIGKGDQALEDLRGAVLDGVF